MKRISAHIIILSGVLAVNIAFVAGNYQIPDRGVEASNISPAAAEAISPEILPADISINSSQVPSETPYPEPDYKPALRPYRINKDHDIWHAEDPISYITPQNEWVRYYASQLYVDHDGRIRYKNIRVPWVAGEDGRIISWIDKPFLNNYQSDDVRFNYPANGDMWVMPDYYLTSGMSDDCDGWAVTVASLLLSGELSVKQSGYFIKQIIPAKVVLGYVDNYRDAWVEYDAYNKTFFTSTSWVNSGPDGKGKTSSTSFMERKAKVNARPVFEFTDRYFGEFSGTSKY